MVKIAKDDMIKLVAIVVAALLMLSCKDRPAPFQNELTNLLTAPTDISVKLGMGKAFLEWRYEETDDFKEFRVYRKDGEDGLFNRIVSTTDNFYADTMLVNGQVYYYEIAAVDLSGFEGSHSQAVSIIPSIYSLLIEEGAEATSSDYVSLRITAPKNTAFMMLSNDSTFQFSSWESFSESRSWQLSPGDGLKTIYAKFRDSNDYETQLPVKAQIKRDSFAQIYSLQHDGAGRVLGGNDVLHIRMHTSDPHGIAIISVIEPDSIVISNDKGTIWIKDIKLYDSGIWGDQVPNDGIYEYDLVVNRGMEVRNAIIVGDFTDALGNRAATVHATDVILFSEAPTTVSLMEPTDGGASTPSLALRWTMNNDLDFASYQLYRSTNTFVGLNSFLVTEITDPGTLRYVDSKLEPSTLYYYRIYSFDTAGNSSASNVVSTTSPQNKPPKPVMLSQAINDDSTSLTLTWSPSTAGDFANYQLFRSLTENVDTLFAPIRIISNIDETQFQDRSVVRNIDYYYQIFVTDVYGLKSGSNIVSGRIE
ncbi:hypothetical protein JW998_04050 [candidate division KSB1 bacterium]|nr:hypothetical protein [candidate division KSB1 bacterium]